MAIVTLKAHFNGKQIQLDEPFELQPNTPLLITVLDAADDETKDWLGLSLQGLAAAYSDDELEYPHKPYQGAEPNL